MGEPPRRRLYPTLMLRLLSQMHIAPLQNTPVTMILVVVYLTFPLKKIMDPAHHIRQAATFHFLYRFSVPLFSKQLLGRL